MKAQRQQKQELNNAEIIKIAIVMSLPRGNAQKLADLFKEIKDVDRLIDFLIQIRESKKIDFNYWWAYKQIVMEIKNGTMETN